MIRQGRHDLQTRASHVAPPIHAPAEPRAATGAAGADAGRAGGVSGGAAAGPAGGRPGVAAAAVPARLGGGRRRRPTVPAGALAGRPAELTSPSATPGPPRAGAGPVFLRALKRPNPPAPLP